MSRPTSSQSDSEWAEAFRTAISQTCRKPDGKGWKTLRELCEISDPPVSTRTMSVRIQGLIKAGRVERFDGTEPPPSGTRINRQTWYRVVPKKK